MRKTPDYRLNRLERPAKLFAGAGRRYRDLHELEDKVNIVLDFQIENEARFAQNEKRFAQNEERFARSEKKVAAQAIRTDKRFAELARFQSITERRLAELMHSLRHGKSGSTARDNS